MDGIFLFNIFRLYLTVKSKIFHNCTRKNLILSLFYYWARTISLRVMDQKFLHCRKVCYRDSYLDSVFCYTKVFRLHAILHDAAGAVRLQTGEEPGYCHMIGQGPNCFWLVTGLADWPIILSVGKNLSILHFQFNRLLSQYVIDRIRISMSLIVIDIFKELGLFIDISLQEFFCPPKTFKPNKQTTWNTSHLYETARSSGKLEYEKLFAVFYNIKVMNAEKVC